MDEKKQVSEVHSSDVAVVGVGGGAHERRKEREKRASERCSARR